MKKEIMDSIAPILEKTKEGIIKAAELLAKELPEVVREIYAWGMVQAILWFVILLGVGIGLLLIAKACFKEEAKQKKETTSYHSTGEGLVIGQMVGVMFGIPIVGFSIWPLSIILKIVFAPRLYLISYLSDLIK